MNSNLCQGCAKAKHRKVLTFGTGTPFHRKHLEMKERRRASLANQLTSPGNSVPDVNSGRTGRVPRCGETPARRNRQADDIAAVALVVRLAPGAGIVNHSQRRRRVDDACAGGRCPSRVIKSGDKE